MELGLELESVLEERGFEEGKMTMRRRRSWEIREERRAAKARESIFLLCSVFLEVFLLFLCARDRTNQIGESSVREIKNYIKKII